MAMNVGLRGLRGTLEAALEADNLSPLIKLVCSAPPRQSAETEALGSGRASPSPATPPSTGRARDEALPIAEGTLEAVIQTLQGISDRREVELKRTCDANATEIAAALRELSTVQATAAELRRRAQDTAASMQRMGSHFSGRMDALKEAQAVRERVTATRAALATAAHVVSFCDEAAEAIDAGELFHARRLLSALSMSYGPALRAAGGGPAAEDHAGAPAAQLGAFAGVLLGRMAEMDAALDVRLNAGLGEWLTRARAAAADVGRAAMVLVEAEATQTTALASQRSAVLKNLGKGPGTEIKEPDGAPPPVDPAHPDPVAGLDMTLLLRNVHVHAAAGSLPSLLDSYVESRQAQLGADLAPPADLLASHRAFLAQIVGYFVIEAHVAALAPQLGSAAHAEAAWEGAAAALAAELGAAIDEAGRSEDIRGLKAAALLACDAIDACCGDGLPTRAIRAALADRAERHRAALATRVAAALDSAAGDGNAVEMAVQDTAAAVGEYLAGLVAPHEAAAATFTEVDRALAAAVASKVAVYIAEGDEAKDEGEEEYDSGSEWSEEDDEEEEEVESGSGSGGEQGDSESEGYVSSSGDEEEEGEEEAGSRGAAADAVEGGTAVEGEKEEEEEEEEGVDTDEFMALLRLVMVASAAQEALGRLRTRLLGDGGAAAATEALPTQLGGVLAAAEDEAGRRIAYDTEPAVDAVADEDLAPTTMPRTGGAISSPFAEILGVLREADADVAAAGVPPASRRRVAAAAVRRVGDDVLRLLASDEVPFINAFGAQALLRDLEAVSKFCEEVGGPGGATWAAGPVAVAQALAFNTAGDLLDARKRSEKFADVNLERVARVLEKVKDTPGLSAAGASARAGRGFISRAAAIKVAAGLREAVAAEQGGS